MAVWAVGAQGKTGALSNVARFETGLKTPDDWKAHWIGMAAGDRQRSAPRNKTGIE